MAEQSGDDRGSWRDVLEEVEDKAEKCPIVVLSSSEDEPKGNGDLGHRAVEKVRDAEMRRERLKEKRDVIDVSSSEEVEIIGSVRYGGGGAANVLLVPLLEAKKKRRRNKKRNKKKEKVDDVDVDEKEQDSVVTKVNEVSNNLVVSKLLEDATVEEKEPNGIKYSHVNEASQAPVNAILKKLLRGPRYFNPGSNNWEYCYNCREEGHTSANCTMEKRQKPCFVCGMFGHSAKHCTQGKDCFICNKRGHLARSCPGKGQSLQNSNVCLRCGAVGHEMSFCTKDYAPEDLKEIPCYVCRNFGHLCCAGFVDAGPKELSCYNCGQTGHTGVGCAKSRGETSGAVAPPTLCYVCGEEGHFARGCTKNTKPAQFIGETSTPTPKYKRPGDFVGPKSVPRDFGRPRKRKGSQHEEWNMTAGKSRIKGGWIVDDPGDLPPWKSRAKGWKPHSKHSKKARKPSTSPSSVHYSTSHYPHKKHKPFPAPGSSAANQHVFAASRFGKSGSYSGRS